MKAFLYISLLLAFCLGLNVSVQAQTDERIAELEEMLDSLTFDIPGLRRRSDLALSNAPLSDYLRALGKVHQINLYIDDTPKLLLTNDFSNESVKSIFIFLCQKFNYTIEPIGTILNFVPYDAPKQKKKPRPPKKLKISYSDSLLSFDLQNDTLDQVLREVSRLSGYTILIRPGVDGVLSGYIPASDFKTALENLLFSNGLTLQRHRKGFFIVDRQAGVANTGNGRGGNAARNPSESGPMYYELMTARDSLGEPLVFIQAENQSLNQIVRDLFADLQQEFFLLENLSGNSTISLAGAPLDDVLGHIFRGTSYSFRKENGVYLIGNREVDEMRQIRIVNLRYRPTEKVIELMPTALKAGVELKEFVELNRIILSGPADRLRAIEAFIKEIDRPVPMVKIEMVVVDVDFNRLLKTGVRAGLLQPGDSVGAVKSLLPGVNYGLDGNAINGILAASGVPALAAVGTLRSNFYVQLQAQESRGVLKVVTRPVISTLNGNEASITIGQTDYYRLETNTASNGAVNAFTQVSQRFETIEINTTIVVKPQVSHDGMVTMDIAPDFTTPGAQADPNIPPTILQRSFQSTIRIRDGETVVLGGLSRESQSNSTDGLPLIARIPVLKWIFGNNSRNKGKSSLIIYITPTITYN